MYRPELNSSFLKDFLRKLDYLQLVTVGILLTVGLIYARRREKASESYESCYAKCTSKLSIVKKDDAAATENNAPAQNAEQVVEGGNENGTEN